MPPGKEYMMKLLLLVSLALTLIMLILPVIILEPRLSPDSLDPDPPPAIASPIEQDSPSGAGFDSTFSITLKDGDNVTEISMEQYLQGSVAAEMPASFEIEALKAQAVALRTYVLQKILSGPSDAHPQADICSDSSCCAAWRSEAYLTEKWGDDFEEYSEKISSAVSATDGQCVTYDGNLAQTVFHSSSAGMTEDSGNVWNSSVPYLRPVKSPEGDGVPNYETTVEVSLEDFKETILEYYPEAGFPQDISTWISGLSLTGSGRVDYLTVGGIQIPGTAFRSMFGLRSTAFHVTTSETSVIFNVTGYGHGVGMSQYGANSMAQEGASWQDILLWYYPGTILESASSIVENQP